MSAIHQFLAGFTRGDAISNEAVVLRRIFRSWGYTSDIFSNLRHVLPEFKKEVRDAGDYLAAQRSDDIAFLHLSIGSPVNDIFAGLSCRKVILYHNITPPDYFRLINPNIANDLRKGFDQVRRLAGQAQVNLADSHFNAAELTAAGYHDVKVLPLLLDFDQLKLPPDPAVMQRLNDGRTTVAFVGRCAPNKCLDDLLDIFTHFTVHVEPNSKLVHAGSFAGTERYYGMLLAQTKQAGLTNAFFLGSVPQTHLNAIYRSASIFLCASEHEGFCIPLLEAMINDVPVVAFSAAAVPETLDGAGVLFDDKRPEFVAEMLGQIIRNPAMRAGILAGQRKRVERLHGRDLAAELRQHLAPVFA